MNATNALLQKIENAKNLDFGYIFNRSIELFKKVWVQGLVSYLLNMLLMIPLIIVVYIPMIFLGIISPETFEQNADLNGAGILVIISSIILFLFILAATVCMSLAFKAAFFRIIKNKDLGVDEPDDYFFFLKKKYLKKTLGLSLIIFGIVILAYILCVLPILYVIVPIYFTVVTFAINPDMPNSDIVKIGFKLGNKKWLITFGLLFVAWIVSTAVGILLCLIGLYVTQQFIDMPVYHVYKESVGFDETSPIEEIGTTVE